MIGRVGTVGDDSDAAKSARMVASLASQLAHMRQAHLGNEVEIVFVDNDDARFGVASSASLNSAIGSANMVIEDGDGNPCRPQCSCGVERAKGRIRLHLAPLFGVVRKVIGVREQNVDWPSSTGLSRHLRTPLGAPDR